MFDIRKIFNDAQYAIQHVDDVLARKLLKEIDGALSHGQNQTDPRMFSQLSDLKLKLSIVNFPNLSEEAAADILRNHYLDSYAIGVSMENRITAMLFFYPEIPRDDLRKKLKMGLVQNQQKIGQLTIGQWIQEFEKMFPVSTRDLSASVRFSIEHAQTRVLSPIEREKLKEILHTYDYLLVTTLPATGPVLEQILRSTPVGNDRESLIAPVQQGQPRFAPSVHSQKQYPEAPASQSLLQMTLTQALKEYPNLGEQNITSDQIKLKYFPTPVRPSIKNWMTDFHDSMGSMTHSPIDRGNFLFHSENAKKLTPIDRQKLGTILKSLDEQILLTIDPAAQVVVFANQQESQPESVVKVQPPKRESLPDINLKQVQHQREIPAPVQPVQQHEVNRNNVAPAVSPFNVVRKESEKKENFFEIPQSKPPIGSDHYNVEKTAKTEEIKKPELNIAKEAVVQQDRNTMSDDLLYRMLQEKKNISQQTASPAGAVSFSSPQKLPAEQSTNPVLAAPVQSTQQPPAPKADEFSKPLTQNPQRSPFHIAPLSNDYEKKDVTPKIQRNVVDLKN